MPDAPAPRLVHLTDAHPREDVRIFAKECRTLAAAGYEVHLVAPGDRDVAVDGVAVHAIRPAAGRRLERMTRAVRDVYRVARSLDADVYHLHDPELLPVGLLLRLRGKIVVYDAHEHLPKQIRTKAWIPAWLRAPLARAADIGERLAARFMSAVVTAEPYVRPRFETIARTATVKNYPMLEEFPQANGDWAGRERAVCYIGSLTAVRGAHEMVQAIARTDAKLAIAGRLDPPTLETELAREPGWARVEALGQIPRTEVSDLLARVRAGLVLFLEAPHHVEANPTKTFEYMSAGLPVIASDLPALARIVNTHECGLCVDSSSPDQIAEAIRWILDHPDDARRMGENGRRAVHELYNWEVERRALLELYADLVGPPPARSA